MEERMNSTKNSLAVIFLFLFAWSALSAHANQAPYSGSAGGDLVAWQLPSLPRTGVYVDGVEISLQGGTLTLSWAPVLESGCYKVYSSADPEGPFSLDDSGTLGEGSWTTQVTEERRFYYVSTDLAYVEGGTFNNGSANVTLSGFYLHKHEVTQGLYEQVMGTNPSQNFGVGPDYPVYLVYWGKAVEFCNRYSLGQSLDPCYSYSTYGTDPDAWPAGWYSTANHTNLSCDWEANGYRLPTDMEWEYAARGGKLSQGFTYSGSDTIGDVAWYSGNAGNLTHPVGTKDPNELGIYDLSGNVAELCWDVWGSLPGEDQTDPHGPSTGDYRVLRNGGRTSPESQCEVTYRTFLGPSSSSGSIGFRVCRRAPKVPQPVFDPPSGAYGLAQSVNITCANPAAVIRYTTNGSEPTAESPVWDPPHVISGNLTVKAKAYLNGMEPSQTATAVYRFNNPVFIAGGTFNNGTSNVTLSSFYLWRFELTQSEYEAVTGTNPASAMFGIGPNLPVYNVNWMEALAFCNRRSILEGLTPCYSYLSYGTDPDDWPYDACVWPENHTNFSCNWNASGYRLPTEAEWEFAARGGNASQGYIYSGSDTIGDVAWYSGNTSFLHDIGGKSPNELGLCDMSGNVTELCWDIHADYPAGPQTDPHGPSTGVYRIRRGGLYESYADYCRVFHRSWCSPALRTYGFGFRVCRKTLAP